MRAFFFFFIISILIGCDIQTPSAKNESPFPAKLTFDHSGITQSCSTCHDGEAAFKAWPEAHRSVSGLDCKICHTTSNWKNIVTPHTAHSDLPISCNECHADQRPKGYVGKVGLVDVFTATGGLFNHASHGGDKDCVSCHVSKRENLGVTWAGGVYTHSPLPTSCLGCHTAEQRPTGAAAGLKDHDKLQGGHGECFNCHGWHGPSVGRSWKFIEKFSHNPKPQSCTNCHAADRDFVTIQHLTVNQMNHGALKLQDCVSCHTPSLKTKMWKTQGIANGVSTPLSQKGIFHKNHSQPLTTCIACHEAERPKGIVSFPPFDHSKLGKKDCVTCHTSVSEYIGLTWKHPR